MIVVVVLVVSALLLGVAIGIFLEECFRIGEGFRR